MSELMFYDRVEKLAVPLRVLILGPEGAGKKTFFNLLKKMNPAFEGGLYEDINGRDDCNVCVGLPDEAIHQMCIDHNIVTHTFWVDSGDRVERDAGYEYALRCDPHRMIIVDNSGTLEDFEQNEVKFCYDMLNIVTKEKSNVFQK